MFDLSPSVLIGMRNVSGKIVEKIKTHFMFNNCYFGSRAFYEITRNNILDPDRPHMTI
jgi:hypothetical protein